MENKRDIFESVGSEIIIYQTKDGHTKIDVKFEDETVWLTQAQLCELYQTSKSNISEHIKNIYEQGELDESSTVRDFRTVRQEGRRYVERVLTYYNLDAIISIGFRVNSKRGIQFRQWANNVLKEYLLKGHAVNYRLEQMDTRLQKHNSQYPLIEVHVCKKCHDRFLIIDGTDIWHIGASLKDLGKKMFAFSKLEIPAATITALL